MAENKLSKARSLAKNGELLRAWNIKEGGWNLTISPALMIDKVKFSFFLTGKQGQGFDLFVDAGQWYLWCKDLVDTTMLRVLSAEKQAGERFAKYYNIPNFGTDGKNSFGMSLADKPGHIVINGKKDQSRAIVPVPIMSEDGLRIQAEKFVRIYEKHLEEIVTETVEASQKWFKDHSPQVEEDTEPKDAGGTTTPETTSAAVEEVAALFEQPSEPPKPAAPVPMPFVGIIQGAPVSVADGTSVFKAMIDGEIVGVQYSCEPTAAILAGTGEFKCTGVKEGKLLKVTFFM